MKPTQGRVLFPDCLVIDLHMQTIQTHGVAVGLKQNTATVIRADLDALTAAEETAALKRTAKATATAGNKTADSNGKAFIARFIQLEKPRIGYLWGPLWQEAGFSAGSISMPGTQGDRFVLIGEIKKFLGNHPECVITDAARPDLDVTEAVATAQYLAISAARTGVNDKTNESSAAATARETALDTLRRRLGGLRDELTQLPLPPDSPLWYVFGFNRPADPATPGKPRARRRSRRHRHAHRGLELRPPRHRLPRESPCFRRARAPHLRPLRR